MSGERPKVTLKQFVSAGEVFLHGDGKTFEILPVSLFRNGDKTILRVGRSTYWFDEDGTFDGVRFSLADGTDPKDAMALANAIGTCPDNRGRAPETSFFSEEMDEHKDEIALWPEDAEEKGPLPVEPPKPPLLFTECCDCGWMLPRMIRTSDSSVRFSVECPRCGEFFEGRGSDSKPS